MNCSWRWEEARSHFDTALRVNARLGARPLVALTQHMYALMLLACGQPGDAERAALAKIAEPDPSLSHYLSSTLTTGLFCSFTPDPGIPITWRF